jgi:protein-tyrosine phosphatase
MKQLFNKAKPFGVALLAALAFAGCAGNSARTVATPAVAVVAAEQDVQPIAADSARRLSLQGAHNVRSFANLRGSRGPIPAGSFLRADDLTALTAADRDALAAAGVTLDVDLRTKDEATTAPDALANDARFKYLRISLMGTEHIDMSSLPDSLGEMYVQSLATVQPQFLQVFRAMAAEGQGTVLFHCTAGKDRTGMVAAMLLSLAGVPRNEIIHNYAITAHYLRPTMAQNSQIAGMLKANPKLIALMGSRPSDMEAFLDAMNAQYGGALGYLKTIGLNEAEIRSLMARMGQA